MLKRWLPQRVSEERKAFVIKEIAEGSTPEPRFYFMVVISTLIAANGLVANSPAVIIGAMLVAPLMTPIFGVALAMVRSDGYLLTRSLRAETMGVSLSVLLGFLFGLIPLAIDPTPEMLARIHPNLLDLCVAVLAGLAGSYAMVDERISPSLPGVAIATAIVPPLANAGLCLALGAYAGAIGSFLLFLANFLSILLASSAVFFATSMHTHFETDKPGRIVKKFGVATVSFAVITVLFTFSLVELVQERYLRRTIDHMLTNKFSKIPGVVLDKVLFQHKPELLNVLVTVQTSTVFDPNKVRQYEREISKMFDLETRLIIRSNLTKDIAATGSTSQITAPDLDGDFIDENLSSAELRVMLAEQVLWEEFSHWPGFQVQGVDYREVPAGKFIWASIQCLYPPGAQKVRRLEADIRERIGDPDVHLIINSSVPMLTGSRGRILYEWSQVEELTEGNGMAVEEIERAVREEMERFKDIFLVNVHFRIKDEPWRILVEAVGPQALTPEQVTEIKKAVIAKTGRGLDMQVWFRSEVVVGEQGYQAYEDFIKEPLMENQKMLLDRSSRQDR
jgi:uncharacterized hydrophobic protein (TIGR00271 family)